MDGVRLDDETLSERAACELMVAELDAVGVLADPRPTGGDCWAVYVPLDGARGLHLYPWPAWTCATENPDGDRLASIDLCGATYKDASRQVAAIASIAKPESMPGKDSAQLRASLVQVGGSQMQIRELLSTLLE